MRWLEGLRRSPPPIQDEAWDSLIASSALFDGLDLSSRSALRSLVARFLHDKRFHGAAGHVPDTAQKLAVAAMACLPVVNLGYDSLRGWRDVILYPGCFRGRREHVDDSTGVVTTLDEDMIGEAWERGPIVLSWADVSEDLVSPFDGFNVVIHEIAHKLDMLDGAMNGVPRLPAHLPRRHWIDTLQAAYDDFRAAVEEGEDVAIDPYAAESAEEFFAVLSEYHHSAPGLLKSVMPAVSGLLSEYYGNAS